MCRSIKTLRRSQDPATDQEIYEAALQFIRKVSGYRAPSRANEAVFNTAVDEVASASRKLLESLQVRGYGYTYGAGLEPAPMKHLPIPPGQRRRL